MEPQLLDVDERGRVALGKVGRKARRYLATADDDGTITLVPAVVMTARQANFLADPARAAALDTTPGSPDLVEVDLDALVPEANLDG